MKVEEIMIGDWITHAAYLHGGDNPPHITNVQIKNIYGYEINCKIEDYTILSGTRLSECKPIPITEELLRKNGFYVYSNDDYSEAKLEVEIDNLNYQICGTRKTDKWHISIYKTKWEDRTKGKRDSCCLFSSGLFGEYKQIYVHEMQHYLRVSGLNDLADNFKIE